VERNSRLKELAGPSSPNVMDSTSPLNNIEGISAFNDSSDGNLSTFSKVSHSVISTKTRDGKKKIN
jgi:hypothetical protein